MLKFALKVIFFWVPKAVHWAVVLSPLALTYAIHELAGLEFAAISVLGAALFLYKTMWFPRDDHTNALSSQILTGRSGKKVTGRRVAVIGAGPAGLCTAKECVENGHDVTTYDAWKQVGGEFGNRFWPGGRLTSSPYVTCFSDFEPKKKPNGQENWLHKTKEEYVAYLNEYAEHYNVTPTLKLEQAVVKVSMKKLSDDDAPTYNLTVVSWKDGKKQMRTDGPYDHIAFCIGGNRTPHIPESPGFESFKKAGGEVYHSAHLGNANSVEEAFNWADNKRVVGVGMGESMADIYALMLDEHPRPPKDCYVAIRSGSWVIPRVNPLNGLVNDWDSTRVRYSMPKWAHNMSVVFCGFLADSFALSENKERSIRFKLIKSIPGAKPCYKPATKSNRFISCLARDKAQLIHAGVSKFEGKKMYFTDGTVVEDVDCVIYGTGFEKFDPFVDQIVFEGQAPPEVCPCGRFLRMFDPAFGSSVAFIGMGIRPLVGSVPTISEIQARLFALVVSGERTLPPTDVMVARAASDRDLSFKEFGTDNANGLSSSNGWKSVTNWIPYMDTIAREIGCLPPARWMITRPFLAAKLMYGPMNVMHYRLSGPGAKPDLAESVVRRLPIGARLVDMMFYTGIHTTLALIRWPFLFLDPSFYGITDSSKSAPKVPKSMKKQM